MEARAVAKYIRISPQKTMAVANLIRGKKVREALAILRFTPTKASTVIAKVLKSAVANAEHNYAMDTDELYVSKICVDQGPTLKRYRPRAQGRADLKRRKTSHITVVVSQKEV
ncbi:MAG: 50S ribosomal protein L22 [Zhaonellaceae bacterium]|jgi:large subunit ribosomal protein L22|nr:50S ribosomal protein L22 [Clostridia bacterium]